jgi:hypothetical protein
VSRVIDCLPTDFFYDREWPSVLIDGSLDWAEEPQPTCLDDVEREQP